MWARARIITAATAAAATGALGACHHAQAPVRKPGEEYLKAIEVEGNRRVKDRDLTSGLALKRAKKNGRAPDPYLVQLDRDRIRGEYLRRGFFGIDVRSRVDRADDAATVVYTVEEGKRAATRVVITGLPDDPDLPLSKVRSKLPLADGAPFDYEVYDLAKPNLLGVIQDAGYAHAKLDSTVYADRANRIAIVQLDYDVGPKCTFGAVEVSGVTGDLADAVRARAQFSSGDRFSMKALIATQRQLYAMSRFSTVQVQPEETASPVVGVKIAVSEAARREVRLGGGFGLDPTAYEARARVGYTIAGWPFPLDTVTIDLRPAYAYMRDGSGLQPRLRALARFERQDLFWTYAKGEVDVSESYVAIEPYTYTGPRLQVGFLTPLGTPRVQAAVGWSIERLSFPKVAPAIVEAGLEPTLHLDAPQRVGEYMATITLDLRDNPIEPTAGAYAALRSALGTPFAGGAFQFEQLVPDVRGYVPVGPVVLSGHLRVGTFFGDIPATERFFSGGASNHRGFGERQLSPSVTDGTQNVPYGGGGLVETGVEGRFPITTWRSIGIGGALFLDGGDVRERLADINPGTLLWAVGAGLRFHTIVGPVRADLGYRINRTGPDDPVPGSKYAFHLSLGEAF